MKSCTNTVSLYGTPVALCHPYPESLLLLAQLGYSGGHGEQCLSTTPIATLAPRGRAQMMEAYSLVEEGKGTHWLLKPCWVGFWILEERTPPEAFIASETPLSANM